MSHSRKIHILDLTTEVDAEKAFASLFKGIPMEIGFKTDKKTAQAIGIEVRGNLNVSWCHITRMAEMFVFEGACSRGFSVRCWYCPDRSIRRIELKEKS
ncbi:MAG: hypothetical protein WC725_04510 [Patescibacteria group bacterium]|jgi:hypothetical protein